jgi:hypoxanthine phosphoribosyltransferase
MPGVQEVCSEILFSQEQIAAKVAELGAILSEKLSGKRPVLIGVLRGGFIFAADIAKSLTIACEIDFSRVQSYSGTESTGNVQIKMDVGDIKGREVLVCEDIVDSGRSMTFLRQHLLSKEPKNITTVVLLDKKSKRAPGLEHITADYIGFEVPDGFVVGCGIDYNGLYRNLPYVGILDPKFIERK